MKRKVTITFSRCDDCPFFYEGNSFSPNCCINEKSPGGENTTPITDIRTIPEWCPLEKVD